MGVRHARKVPPPVSQVTRVTLGTLTFLLWYAAMLSAMGLLAMATGREVQQIRFTVLGLFAATAVAWLARRLLHRAHRRLLARATPPDPAAVSDDEAGRPA